MFDGIPPGGYKPPPRYVSPDFGQCKRDASMINAGLQYSSYPAVPFHVTEDLRPPGISDSETNYVNLMSQTPSKPKRNFDKFPYDKRRNRYHRLSKARNLRKPPQFKTQQDIDNWIAERKQNYPRNEGIKVVVNNEVPSQTQNKISNEDVPEESTVYGSKHQTKNVNKSEFKSSTNTQIIAKLIRLDEERFLNRVVQFMDYVVDKRLRLEMSKN